MSDSQPNVVVFFTDQQRWDTTGVHGCPLDLTPNFDRLARAGTDVHYAVTSQPVCGPARSCLQTGQYATTTGCYRNGIALPAESRTLAHYFSAAGYATGYIGKWHLADQGPGAVPTEQRGGYAYWLAANALEFTSDAYDCVMYDNGGEAVKLPGYRVDAQTDAAIRYIDAHQDDPFFLFISYLEPHHQNHRDDYPAPPGYETRYRGSWMPPDLRALGGSAHQQWAGYCGMIKRLDEALGRLVDALISLDKLEDTIILFTSDHGNHFKTRNAEYKRSCHEASVRLPTMLHGGPFTGGGRISQLVSLVDLPPTLLDAAGIPVPAQMQGRSILPLLRGDAVDWQKEVFMQISEAQVGRAIRSRRWKYAVQAPHRSGRDHADSDRYVESELYDLLADPEELDNRAGCASHREVAEVLRGRLIQSMLAAGESEPTIELAPAQNCINQWRVSSAEAWH
ncbi:MAG: sulfatase-like hydrolase/transferase [Chloroflexi bacterium]|nr:sulfatase-like hydrolase/transferase [Chloroflexota bacterium]MCY3582572.1 sulfatase-like hydrolase/transferase [Chloroflexota bacterium]MCY3717920.1 sulfatase-like hydrolase/transferase [Chloroflexota bacterium]MDE2649130.1 sulfatase-like hydrolase/transferase [Chloroflexota bacterium]MXV92637.1 sulfatase-like hydrolase/transferase [Chloroflexota bacterium]